MNYKDKNGKVLEHGMSVLVPEPDITDMHNNEFVGYLEKIEKNCAFVSDGEGDWFTIEPHRLQIHDENEDRIAVEQYLSKRN